MCSPVLTPPLNLPVSLGAWHRPCFCARACGQEDGGAPSGSIPAGSAKAVLGRGGNGTAMQPQWGLSQPHGSSKRSSIEAKGHFCSDLELSLDTAHHLGRLQGLDAWGSLGHSWSTAHPAAAAREGSALLPLPTSASNAASDCFRTCKMSDQDER
jgi:hypothetical protein